MTADRYTIQEFWLDVSHGHKLYVQEWGNPKAKPIIYLHGGPGSGLKDHHKQRFEPNQQRVIFFDQRGSGQSTPYGSLENNTTEHLVDDINKIADHFKFGSFILTGGSWGSTLALVYAIKHTERVSGLVLSGVFSGSKREINWLNNGELKNFFPDAWQRLLDKTPASHHSDPLNYHAKRALNNDAEAAKESAYVYETLESDIVRLDDRPRQIDWATYDPVPITIEIYYLVNNCFLTDNFVLDNASKLNMPVWIVQGRYDMVCPPITAYLLHQKIASSKLIWTINGHLAEHEASNIIGLAHQQLSLQP